MKLIQQGEMKSLMGVIPLNLMHPRIQQFRLEQAGEESSRPNGHST